MITGGELPSFPPAEIYSSLRVTFLYIHAQGDLKGGDERQPWRHELGPKEQGDKLRFELYEHENDSTSVYLLCSEDLL